MIYFDHPLSYQKRLKIGSRKEGHDDRFWAKIDAKLSAGLPIPLGPTWSRSWVSGMSTKWETIALCRRQERDLHFYRAHQQSKCFAALETENDPECCFFFSLGSSKWRLLSFQKQPAHWFRPHYFKVAGDFCWESWGKNRTAVVFFFFRAAAFVSIEWMAREKGKTRDTINFIVSRFSSKKKEGTWIGGERENKSLRSQFCTETHQNVGGFRSAGNNEWRRQAKWKRNIARKIGSAVGVN